MPPSVTKELSVQGFQDIAPAVEAKYASRLSPDELEALKKSSLNTLQAQIDATELIVHGKQSGKILNRLQPVLESITSYTGVFDVYVNAYPLALAPLWGSIKLVVLVRKCLHHSRPCHK